jgi:hypothetical protein
MVMFFGSLLGLTPASRRVNVSRRLVVNIIAEFYHNMMKNMLYRPQLAWIKGRKKKNNNVFGKFIKIG